MIYQELMFKEVYGICGVRIRIVLKLLEKMPCKYINPYYELHLYIKS